MPAFCPLPRGAAAFVAVVWLVAACSPVAQPPGSAVSIQPTAGSIASPSASTVPSASPAAAAAPVGGLRTVKVGTIPVIGMAPFLIAQQKGYFAQEGLDLELDNFASGAEMVSPLSTGQIDAAINVAPNAGLVNAIARGLTVRIAADNGSIHPQRNVGSFVIRKDLQPAGGFADLSKLPRPVKGSATAEGVLPHALVVLVLQQAGVPVEQVDMTFLGLPDMNVAVANSRVDFGASGEPLITIGEQSGQLARWKPMNDVFPGLLYSVMLYGPNLLEKDKELGVKLMRVYLKGTRDFEDAVTRGTDRATIIGMLAGPLRMSPELFDQLQTKGGMAYIEPDGKGDPATLKPVIDFWAQTGKIPQAVDPLQLVDFSAAEAALKDLGPYKH